MAQPCPHCRSSVRQTRADGLCVACGSPLPEELRASPDVAVVAPPPPVIDREKKDSEDECERLMQGVCQQREERARVAPHEDFYASILPLHRQILVLWEMHAQVYNGGFGQWLKNGYAKWIDDAMATAKEIGTKEALEFHAILEDLSKLLQPNDLTDDEWEGAVFDCSWRYHDMMQELWEGIDLWLYRKRKRS